VLAGNLAVGLQILDAMERPAGPRLHGGAALKADARPAVGREAPLTLDRRRHRIAGIPERRVEGVPHRLDDVPSTFPGKRSTSLPSGSGPI
jgi:hypothetical protein